MYIKHVIHCLILWKTQIDVSSLFSVLFFSTFLGHFCDGNDFYLTSSQLGITGLLNYTCS
jgi:hypothetical protein